METTVAFEGGCQCGGVRVRLARLPEYVNDCDCSLCRPLGVLWGYFSLSEIEVEGETAAYVRNDIDNPVLSVHFCKTCGATSHWSPLPSMDVDRTGVNMRLFEAERLSGIELRFPDGRNWTGEMPYGFRAPASTL